MKRRTHNKRKDHDPARASLAIESSRRERHPVGVVYIRRITGNPGSSALRASTPGLCRSDPYRGPLRGAPRRSTCPTCGQHPARASPIIQPLSKHPEKDRQWKFQADLKFLPLRQNFQVHLKKPPSFWMISCVSGNNASKHSNH